ncbi:HAD family hydrolase [bacterium]|nr:HAD family hydrolase [bacterium]
MIPTREEAQKLLFEHVKDEYQRHHALMVGTALGEYGKKFGENADLWFMTGYLHDIDFEEHPTEHPARSLQWFKEWGYPVELIQAVEVHALGYNGFTTEPQSKLDAAIIACDEVCGIFYAYSKVNPCKYGDMKASSILKRIREVNFAPKISRGDIHYGCEKLGVTIDEHVNNLIGFFKESGI